MRKRPERLTEPLRDLPAAPAFGASPAEGKRLLRRARPTPQAEVTPAIPPSSHPWVRKVVAALDGVPLRAVVRHALDVEWSDALEKERQRVFSSWRERDAGLPALVDEAAAWPADRRDALLTFCALERPQSFLSGDEQRTWTSSFGPLFRHLPASMPRVRHWLEAWGLVEGDLPRRIPEALPQTLDEALALAELLAPDPESCVLGPPAEAATAPATLEALHARHGRIAVLGERTGLRPIVEEPSKLPALKRRFVDVDVKGKRIERDDDCLYHLREKAVHLFALAPLDDLVVFGSNEASTYYFLDPAFSVDGRLPVFQHADGVRAVVVASSVSAFLGRAFLQTLFGRGFLAPRLKPLFDADVEAIPTANATRADPVRWAALWKRRR